MSSNSNIRKLSLQKVIRRLCISTPVVHQLLADISLSRHTVVTSEMAAVTLVGKNDIVVTPHHRQYGTITNSLIINSSSIYLPYFHIKLQTYIMQWQATRKTQSSTSWRPIINITVVNILLRKNIQWNKKKKKLTDSILEISASMPQHLPAQQRRFQFRPKYNFSFSYLTTGKKHITWA